MKRLPLDYVERISLVDQVAAAIKKEIHNRTLKAGDRLTEAQVVTSLGVAGPKLLKSKNRWHP